MTRKKAIAAALTIGAAWGAFEATIGFLLHLLPVNIGFLIWYPAACFFLLKAYGISGKTYAIPLAAAVACAFKLLNLALPVSLDKVINPAASIISEGIIVWLAVIAFNRIKLRLSVTFNWLNSPYSPPKI